MARPIGDLENLSFETPAKLVEAGVPMAIQSGYEPYVPKTRVVLFEAAMAAANGLSFEQALAAITSGAAKVLGIADRAGSIRPGRRADLVFFDGDPLEPASRVVRVMVGGKTVYEDKE